MAVERYWTILTNRRACNNIGNIIDGQSLFLRDDPRKNAEVQIVYYNRLVSPNRIEDQSGLDTI